jgi:hypothetical protein
MAAAPAPLNIVTTTEDLASLAREVGGDRVSVVALAAGLRTRTGGREAVLHRRSVAPTC